ncbi:MAG: cytochrome c family protein [Rhodospirillaceae bacterium]|nr:cytochrome c family protein [Rhodospirillaceae bacterium]MBT6513037.1 cytochrome c family protein [Rhodospirillaceae bacterium]MBT7615210.1 cytochrome c family protein [Rhodospirillaceae bacterium]
MKTLRTLAATAFAAALATTAMAQEGDPEAGEKVFRKCKSCHTVEADSHRVGPSLYGIIGRTAGTAEGYGGYSSDMEELGIVWDEQNMSEYITDPKAFLPGTKMVFRGISDEQDRADLIAYLISASQE